MLSMWKFVLLSALFVLGAKGQPSFTVPTPLIPGSAVQGTPLQSLKIVFQVTGAAPWASDDPTVSNFFDMQSLPAAIFNANSLNGPQLTVTTGTTSASTGCTLTISTAASDTLRFKVGGGTACNPAPNTDLTLILTSAYVGNNPAVTTADQKVNVIIQMTDSNRASIIKPSSNGFYTSTVPAAVYCNAIPANQLPANSAVVPGCVTTFGGSCLLTCNTGFTGTPTATCQSSGTWLIAGSCTAATVDCGTPSFPGGNVVINSCPTTFGSTCVLTCAAGFNGNPTAVCQSNRQWLYGGSCTASCGAPVFPNTVVVGTCSQVPGGTCTLTCATGYVGSPTAVCQTNGQWLYGGACSPVTVVSCGAVNFPGGNVVVASTCSQNYGGNCPLTCVSGFSGTPTAVCQSNGQWLYGGSCAVTCGTPVFPNAVVVGTCGQTSGSTCVLACASGFYGNPTAVCQTNGQWLYGGSCTSCTTPTLANAVLGWCTTMEGTTTTTTNGGTCYFKCNNGYSGNPYATCVNGQWVWNGGCSANSGGSDTNLLYLLFLLFLIPLLLCCLIPLLWFLLRSKKDCCCQPTCCQPMCAPCDPMVACYAPCPSPMVCQESCCPEIVSVSYRQLPSCGYYSACGGTPYM